MLRKNLTNLIESLLVTILLVVSFAVPGIYAGELVIPDGHNRKSWLISSDEVGFTPVIGQRQEIRVEPMSPAVSRKMSSRAAIQSSGARPVLYPVGAGEDRRDSDRRFGTSQMIVVMPPGENPGMEWFRPAPVRLAPLKIGNLPVDGYWELEFTDGWACLQSFRNFEAHDKVVDIYPVLARKSQSRFIPNDPFFPNQTQLYNTNPAYYDINVVQAWDIVRGDGLTIGIIDDGINYGHSELNVRTDIDVSYTGADPTNGGIAGFSHGTGVAGIAAATGNNSVGIAGIAFNSRLVSIQLTSGIQTDTAEASAFTHQNAQIFVKNNSWGPQDDGLTLEGPGPLARAALSQSVVQGRNGLGTIFLWAGGNGGILDDSNKDGYANSIYTIALGATDLFGRQSSFSESSSSLVGVVPVGDGWMTTNSSNQYFLIAGTSSASAIGSGIATLVIQANPSLGWRDVQDILIRTARKNDSGDGGWRTNGAGLPFNRRYGAGMLDATAAVNLARDASRQKLGPHQTIQSQKTSLGAAIPDNNLNGVTFTFDIAADNFRAEHVTLETDIFHGDRGQLEIELVSPSGMSSRLITNHNDPGDHYLQWPFMSIHHWGENPNGQWRVIVRDKVPGSTGMVNNLKLSVYGAGTIGNPNPDPQAVQFPSQSVPFNSGLQTLNLLPHLPNVSPGQISQASVVANTNPGLLSTAFIQSGELRFQAATGQHGMTTLTLSVSTTTGTIYRGNVVVTVAAPVVQNLAINDQVIPQNAPLQRLNFLPIIGLNNASQLTQLAVTSNTNPALLPVFFISDGSLYFQPAAAQFGETSISISAQDFAGQPYRSTFRIIVQASTVNVTVPVQNVLENSGQHVLNMWPHLNLSSAAEISNLQITQQSNPALLASSTFQNGQFIYNPSANVTGQNIISFQGQSTAGVPYTGTITIVVSPLTISVNVPQQNINQNLSEQTLNLLPYIPLNGSQLVSVSIVQAGPAQLVQYAEFSGAILKYKTVFGASGTASISFAAQDSGGKKYSGTVAIVVTALPLINRTAPQLTVVDNGGTTSLNLGQSLGVASGVVIVDGNITSNTNANLLAGLTLANGSLVFSTRPGIIGQTSLSLFLLDSTGQTYQLSQVVQVNAGTVTFQFADRQFKDNAPLSVFNLLTAAGIQSAANIVSERIYLNSNSGLLEVVGISGGQLRLKPKPGQTGATRIGAEIQLNNNLTYKTEFNVVVEKGVESISVPEISINQNLSEQRLDILPYLGIPSGSTLTALTITRINQLPQIQYARFEGSEIVFRTLFGFSGNVSIEFEGSDSSSRQFAGTIPLKVILLPLKIIALEDWTIDNDAGTTTISFIQELTTETGVTIQDANITSLSDPGLLGNFAFIPEGLRFTVPSSRTGATQIKMFVLDTNGQTYDVTVNVIVQSSEREFSIPDINTQENSSLIAVNLLPLMGIESAATISSVDFISNTNPGLLSVLRVNGGNLEVSPAVDMFGQSAISIVVHTGAGPKYTSTFRVTVNQVPRPVTLPLQSVNQNLGQQTVSIQQFATSNNLGELVSLEITGVAPGGILEFATMENGSFIYQSVFGVHGNVAVQIRGQAANGRIYLFTLPISVISVPPKDIVPGELALSNLAGETIMSSAASVGLPASRTIIRQTLISNSRPDVVSVRVNTLGQIGVTPVPGTTGLASVRIDILDNAGQIYRISQNINVLPVVRNFDIQDVSVVENLPVQSVDLLAAAGLSGGRQIRAARVQTSAASGFFQVLGIDNGILRWQTSQDRFGVVNVSVELDTVDGFTYISNFNIDVKSVTRTVDFGNYSVAENSGARQISLWEPIGLASAAEISLISVDFISDTTLLASATTGNGILNLIPATNRFGTITISLSVRLGSGRLYKGDLRYIVTPLDRQFSAEVLVIQENSGSHSVNVLQYTDIPSVAEIQSEQITSVSNSSLLNGVTVAGAGISLSTAANQFGESEISVVLTSKAGRRYLGRLRVVVNQIPRAVTIPALTYPENTGQQAISIVEYFDFASSSGLASFSIVSHTDASLFVGIAVIDGLLVVQPAAGKFGINTISFEASGSDGRKYFGSFTITIEPDAESVTVPELAVIENSGSSELEIISAISATGIRDISQARVISQSRPGLFTGITFNTTSLIVSVAPDTIGVNTVVVEAINPSGRPYHISVPVEVLPGEKNIVLPDKLVAANSGDHSLSVSSVINPSGQRSISEMKVVSQSDPTLFQQLVVQDDTVIFTPGTDVTGNNVLTLQAIENTGRVYNITMRVTVSTYDFWMSEYFSEEQLSNAGLENTLWGQKADSDGDNWDNLSEYFFGGNPVLRELKNGWYSVSYKVNPADGNTYLHLDFNHRINDPLIGYVIEVSNDNGLTWQAHQAESSPLFSIISRTPVNSGIEKLSVRYLNIVTSGNTVLLRVRISRPE